MDSSTDKTNKHRYLGFQEAFKDYFIESFSELTQAPVVPLPGLSTKPSASHVSKVEVEDGLGEMSITLSIFFVPNPNIVISGASEQPSTADVCAEVGNWVAGRSRSDLQSLGIKSKQTNFKPTLVSSDGEEIDGPTTYTSEIIIEGAGVKLLCRVTVRTKNTERLENWPRQDLCSVAGEMEFL